MVQGQESKEDVEGFIATGPRFCLGNMRVVYWSIVLQETDTLGQHATPLKLDSVPQFPQQ